MHFWSCADTAPAPGAHRLRGDVRGVRRAWARRVRYICVYSRLLVLVETKSNVCSFVFSVFLFKWRARGPPGTEGTRTTSCRIRQSKAAHEHQAIRRVFSSFLRSSSLLRRVALNKYVQHNSDTYYYLLLRSILVDSFVSAPSCLW